MPARVASHLALQMLVMEMRACNVGPNAEVVFFLAFLRRMVMIMVLDKGKVWPTFFILFFSPSHAYLTSRYLVLTEVLVGCDSEETLWE